MSSKSTISLLILKYRQALTSTQPMLHFKAIPLLPTILNHSIKIEGVYPPLCHVTHRIQLSVQLGFGFAPERCVRLLSAAHHQLLEVGRVRSFLSFFLYFFENTSNAK
jgi:hypothetical protein